MYTSSSYVTMYPVVEFITRVQTLPGVYTDAPVVETGLVVTNGMERGELRQERDGNFIGV